MVVLKNKLDRKRKVIAIHALVCKLIMCKINKKVIFESYSIVFKAKKHTYLIGINIYMRILSSLILLFILINYTHIALALYLHYISE